MRAIWVVFLQHLNLCLFFGKLFASGHGISCFHALKGYQYVRAIEDRFGPAERVYAASPVMRETSKINRGKFGTDREKYLNFLKKSGHFDFIESGDALLNLAPGRYAFLWIPVEGKKSILAIGKEHLYGRGFDSLAVGEVVISDSLDGVRIVSEINNQSSNFNPPANSLIEGIKMLISFGVFQQRTTVRYWDRSSDSLKTFNL